MNTYIDIHVLQTVPPSNLNRDDTGSPKTAIYGGVRRARVSSQAWKKATRAAFKEALDESDLALRTTRVVGHLVELMRTSNPDIDEADARARATAVLEAAGLKVNAPKARRGSDPETAPAAVTGYLTFFSNRQLANLAELATQTAPGSKPTKADAQRAADTEHGIEVALFGRMVADDKGLSVDAAVQVAHAISTHAIAMEQDYFTAVDELNTDDAGAGMLGTVEFNSATLYRYATINVNGLAANLGDEMATLRAAQAFVSAFVRSMPTGKQNTFANRTVPNAVLVQIREGQPVNLVGAFEDAVPAGAGYVAESTTRLAKYNAETAAFTGKPLQELVIRVGENTMSLDQTGKTLGSIDDLLASLEEPVLNALSQQR